MLKSDCFLNQIQKYTPVSFLQWFSPVLKWLNSDCLEVLFRLYVNAYMNWIATFRDYSPKNENSVIIYYFSQTYMNFCLLLNIKEDILKNVGNQTADGSHWLP